MRGACIWGAMRRVERPARQQSATTVISAGSARLRRSSSHSGSRCRCGARGDRDVDRAHTGVDVAVAVAVALRRLSRAGGAAVFRAGDSVRVRGGEQGVDHVLEPAAHQVRGGCFGRGLHRAGR